MYLGGKSENIYLNLLATFPVGQTSRCSSRIFCTFPGSCWPGPSTAVQDPRPLHGWPLCFAAGGQSSESALFLVLPQIQLWTRDIPSFRPFPSLTKEKKHSSSAYILNVYLPLCGDREAWVQDGGGDPAALVRLSVLIPQPPDHRTFGIRLN